MEKTQLVETIKTGLESRCREFFIVADILRPYLGPLEFDVAQISTHF